MKLFQNILALFLIIKFTQGNFQSSNDIDLDSLEDHLEQEIEDEFAHIPLKNMRKVEITDLRNLSPEEQKKLVLKEDKNIPIKFPFQYVEDTTNLEEILLRRGIFAECSWDQKLPPEFNQDKCSLAELSFLVENSE